MHVEVPPQDIDHLNRTYRVSRKIVRFVGGNVFGLRVYGLENIPDDEGAIVAANHRRELEVLGLPAAIPDRHVTEVSKYELLEVPVLGAYLRKLGSTPVHRGGPTKEEFSTMVEVPKSGRIEATFPEGTRGKKRKKAKEHADLGQLQPGVARIARLAGVLTIPTALYGMDRLLTYYRVVAFGEPVGPPDNRRDEERWTQDIGNRINDLYIAAHNRELKLDKIRW